MKADKPYWPKDMPIACTCSLDENEKGFYTIRVNTEATFNCPIHWTELNK